MSLLGRIHRAGNVLNIPGRGIVLWKQMPKLLRSLGLLKDIKLSIDGADSMTEVDGGLHFKVAGSGTTAVDPFAVTATSDGTNMLVTVEPGTFANIVPTLDGDPLNSNPAPSFSRSLSGTFEVYLAVAATLVAENDYVTSYTFTAATVGCGASLPSDSGVAPSGTFYVRLATITDGRAVAQYVRSSLHGYVVDNGTGASTGQMSFFRA